jgi:hypothetical protein
MDVTDDQSKLRQEADESHEETLRLLIETDIVISDAQEVLSSARERLRIATEKYKERLYGPKASSNRGPN